MEQLEIRPLEVEVTLGKRVKRSDGERTLLSLPWRDRELEADNVQLQVDDKVPTVENDNEALAVGLTRFVADAWRETEVVSEKVSESDNVCERGGDIENEALLDIVIDCLGVSENETVGVSELDTLSDACMVE